MKPDSRPGVIRQKRRQLFVQRGIHQPVDAPLGNAASAVSAIAR